jgi:DNA-directed RNA polymerase subunit beta'
MVLGVYYLTKNPPPLPSLKEGEKRRLRAFASMDEVELAYNLGQVGVHTLVRLRVMTWYDDEGTRLLEQEERLIETTVGRVIFNRILPAEIQFVNWQLDKGGLKDLVAELYEIGGEESTPDVADRIKDIGFHYATRSGYTIAVSDITVPAEKGEILQRALQEEEAVTRDFRRGLLTEQEQNERVIDIWQRTTNEVAQAVKKTMDPHGNLATMANSGATKGGFGPISQLAGMRGLMADPSGRIIPLPIRSNFREGLTALEYFISTHGARKGLADTALRTADAGYLTRRLVDVAQDLIINDEDCGSHDGMLIRSTDDIAGQSMGSRLFGRRSAVRVVDPKTGEVLAEHDDMLDHERVRRIVLAGVREVLVRSPLTCELIHGICSHCYGMDLGRGKPVEVGAAVGIVAAQSIGEPGTQLTLRTFHTGGVAAGGDITTGLPRVEELFEARKTPKGEAVVSEIGGTARVRQSDRYSDLRIVRVEHSEMIEHPYNIPEGWTIVAEDGGEVSQGDVLAYQEAASPSSEVRSHPASGVASKERSSDKSLGTITAQHAGRTRIEPAGGFAEQNGMRVFVSFESRQEAEYEIPSNARLLVRDGDHVQAGQPLTEGSLNPHRILRLQGAQACQIYLITEVQKVYRSQGMNIHDKHFEVIIRKMLSKVQVTRPGDTKYLPGDLVDRLELKKVNERLLSEGKRGARFLEVLLGITKASLSTDSFLSASSFQHTIKVLAGAAIAASEDPLYGLKENVIIGKLIPAGTGFVRGRFSEAEKSQMETSAIRGRAGSVDGQEEEEFSSPEPTAAD